MKTMQAALLATLLVFSASAGAQTASASGSAPADLARWGVLGRQAEVGSWVGTTRVAGTGSVVVTYATFKWIDATRLRATSRLVSVDGAISYLPEAVTEFQLLDSGNVAFSIAGKPMGETPIQAPGSSVRRSTESGIVEDELQQEGDRLVTRTYSIVGNQKTLVMTSVLEPAAGRTLADLHAAVGR